MGPGDFNDDDMWFVRHPSGELLHLAEWELVPDDARNILRAGADVYVIREDYPWFGGMSGHEDAQQEGLLDEGSALQYEALHVGKDYVRCTSRRTAS